MSVPGLQQPIFLRQGTTDEQAFEEVFRKREYAIPLSKPPSVIVDAGANVGLAALYFALTYPGARIFAIEPEIDNFAVLEQNAAQCSSITAIHGALWSDDEQLAVVDPGMGQWAYRVCRLKDLRRKTRIGLVTGFSMPTLMRRFGIETIDLLKVDVENAEREIFRRSDSWIDHVRTAIVETHDEASDQTVRKALRAFSIRRRDWLMIATRESIGD